MTTRVNLERWRGHIEAAAKRGGTLADYAREHGLSRHTLYVARQQMQREAVLAPAQTPTRRRAAPAAPFVAVRVAQDAAALRVRLPNGVAIEFGALPTSSYTAVLTALAALPCSS